MSWRTADSRWSHTSLDLSSSYRYKESYHQCVHNSILNSKRQSLTEQLNFLFIWKELRGSLSNGWFYVLFPGKTVYFTESRSNYPQRVSIDTPNNKPIVDYQSLFFFLSTKKYITHLALRLYQLIPRKRDLTIVLYS